jgi:hypothetical protein
MLKEQTLTWSSKEREDGVRKGRRKIKCAEIPGLLLCGKYYKDINVFQSFAYNTCIFAVCGGAALSDWLRYIGTPVVDDSVERNNSEVSAIIISHCGSPFVCSIRRK